MEIRNSRWKADSCINSRLNNIISDESTNFAGSKQTNEQINDIKGQNEMRIGKMIRLGVEVREYI